MAIVLDPQEPAINRGIRTVGVGKKGSKALDGPLALEILEDFRSGKVSEAAKGAFFSGLYAKGIEPAEEALREAFSPQAIVAAAPEWVQWICLQLLEGRSLDEQTAFDLGKFMFSDEPGDAARGWVASFLRVRYETDQEYQGLRQAMEDTLIPAFKTAVPEGDPIIQIAEPFDGVDHSYMITPLLGRYLQQHGYRVAHQIGRNSGPKLDMNLWDIARCLKIDPVSGNADLTSSKPDFGWFFHQSLMSPALDRWVEIRRLIIKRPFLATLERFINPLKAEVLIASAFHAPYGEKMMTIAEQAGFKSVIIVRNGIEGSIAFPLLRPVKLLLSSRQPDGSFKRQELNIDIRASVAMEERIEKPKASDNARLIETYVKNGASGNNHFDVRVESTCKGLDQALKSF